MTTMTMTTTTMMMRAFLLWSLLLLLPSLTAAENATTTTTSSNCWDNTTKIWEDMNATSAYEPKTYVLCPHRTYQIGFSYRDGTCCTEGDAPLSARSNVRFLCGEDGRAENNCVFTGGIAQFVASNLLWGGADVFNVQVEGLTFTQAMVSSILIGNKGFIEFKNCVVRDNQNTGPVLIAHEPADNDEERRRRQLEITSNHPGGELALFSNEEFVRGIVNDAFMQKAKTAEIGNRNNIITDNSNANNNKNNRDLQARDWMVVHFTECLFENNVQNEDPMQRTFLGVVSVPTTQNEVHFTDCVFRNNNYADGGAVAGYAIDVAPNNIVKIQNNCFLDNKFVGFGAVRVFGESDFTVENNYGTIDAGLDCQFLAVSEEELPESLSAIECFQYESPTCQARLYLDHSSSSNTDKPPATASSNGGTPVGVRSGMACLVVSLILFIAVAQ